MKRLQTSRCLLVIAFAIAFSSLSLQSCKHSTDLDSKPPFFFALAGEDFTTVVGGYVVLDGSFMCSQPLDTIAYEWTPAAGNPADVVLLFPDRHQVIGFTVPGTYRFILRVTCRSAVSEPDTIVVQVSPNRQQLFIDPHFEMLVRYSINKPGGDLTPEDLAQVDTVINQPFADKVTSLTGAVHCPNFRYLNVDVQDIADLEGLRHVTSLEWLQINQNHRLSDLSPIANLTNLLYLNVYDDTMVTSLAPVANLRKLRYLNAQYCTITDISMLANLTDLETLELSDSPLTDLSPLQNLTKLDILWLRRCQIADLSPLVGLVNLTYLGLWSNRIEDISPLSGCTKLLRLYLAENQITRIDAVRGMTQLNIATFNDNKITNIKPLVDNVGLGSDNIRDLINLRRNPLDSISVYQYIPALQARNVYISWP